MSVNKKLIVISAVGLRQGGTLTILKDCLQYLSTLAMQGKVRVVAIVHKKELAYFEGIEYIELPHVIKSWFRRLWCEYVTMHQISKQLPEVHLWFSLHDTTPRVKAKHQALYCQTSFPFYKRSWHDFYFQYKIALFSLFTRFAYRINIHRNRHIVVQQEWFKQGLSKMLNVDPSKFIVAPPQRSRIQIDAEQLNLPCYTFIYPSAPDCHKNFEVLCQAAYLLEQEVGRDKFKVVITLSGKENRYTRWLYQKWSKVSSIEFVGYLSKERLYGYYQAAHCLVFPSKVETWGLPISEFGETGKPMILANLPYAHETAAGCPSVAYFDVSKPDMLKYLMKKAMEFDLNSFLCQSYSNTASQIQSWEDLFNRLLID